MRLTMFAEHDVSLKYLCVKQILPYSLLHSVHSHLLDKRAAGWQLCNHHDSLLPKRVSTPPAEQYIRENNSCLKVFWPQNSTCVVRYCVLSSQCWWKCKLAKLAHYIMLELCMYEYSVNHTSLQKDMLRCYTKSPTVQDTFWSIQVCTPSYTLFSIPVSNAIQ